MYTEYIYPSTCYSQVDFFISFGGETWLRCGLKDKGFPG